MSFALIHRTFSFAEVFKNIEASDIRVQQYNQ